MATKKVERVEIVEISGDELDREILTTIEASPEVTLKDIQDLLGEKDIDIEARELAHALISLFCAERIEVTYIEFDSDNDSLDPSFQITPRRKRNRQKKN